MTMDVKGWKVLREGRSCVMGKDRGSRSYRPGRWVAPKEGCGPLCVFLDRKAAVKFVDWYGRNESPSPYDIKECLFKPSGMAGVWYRPKLPGDLHKDLRPLHNIPFRLLAPGTVLADSVRIIK